MKAPLFLLIALIFFSCRNQRTVNTGDSESVKPYPHVINMSEGLKNTGQIKLSDIADSIRYIVLSKDKDILIGSFRRLQLTDKEIYINSNGLIMRFDLSGKYLNSFGRLGRGPEEYLSGSPYSTTPENDKILILRSMMSDYLLFKPDGSYNGTRKLSSSRNLFDFVNLSDSVFLFTFFFVGSIMNEDVFESMNCIAGLFDQDGNPIRLIEHPLKNTTTSKADMKRVISTSPLFTFFDNRVVLSPTGDTIYEIDKNSISPGFIFKWGSVPHKQSLEELYFRQSELTNKTTFHSPVFETERKTYFRGGYLSDYFIFEYDKITGLNKSMIVDKDNPGFINDLDGGSNYFPFWTNREGNIWIVNDEANSFKEKNNEELLSKSVAIYPEMKEKLLTFLNDLKMDDNPVLKIVYLKKALKI